MHALGIVSIMSKILILYQHRYDVLLCLQMLTIADLKQAPPTGAKPYAKPQTLKCTVLIIEGDILVVADESDTLKVGIKFLKPEERAKLKEGNMYYIQNIQREKSTQWMLFLNENIKVSYAGYGLDMVPSHIQERGRQMINPTTPPRSPIKDIKPDPRDQGKLVTIVGVVKTVSKSRSPYITSDTNVLSVFFP